MMPSAQRQLDVIVARAKAQGLLPADAVVPGHDDRPWPVVLLTGFGAWFVALPLFAAFGALLSDLALRSAGPYVLGALMLAGAWVLLRSRTVAVFVEQLAVPVALTGTGLLGYGLFRDLPVQAAAAVICAVVLAFGATISRNWLRVLAGAAAAAMFTLALTPERSLHVMGVGLTTSWFTLHGTLAAWLAAMTMQRRDMQQARGARAAQAIEGIAAGWLLFTLVLLAWRSGMTFMVGGAMGSGVGAEIAGIAARELMHSRSLLTHTTALVSILLTVAAATLLPRLWPTMRVGGAPRTAACGVVLVLTVLAWFLPMLGGALLALAICAVTHRWRLAAACGVACAWIIGSFYYLLAWPLATKAGVLVAAGAVLGALVWVAINAGRVSPEGAPEAAPGPLRHGGLLTRRALALIAATGVAVLAIANFSIWQKEDVIANGQPVFVALVPVDPRSLMQGDYMALNFGVPSDSLSLAQDLVGPRRPRVIAVKDARNVATLKRIEGDSTSGASSAAATGDEFPIELTPKGGRWILVTDAWFFSEGDGPRFARARYGEFRVDASGRALLVGLSDENLQAIKPAEGAP